MPYCEQADIEKRISEDDLIALTDDSGSGAVDSDILNKAISQADARINGYLRGRFNLPLDTVPEIINAISVDITVYNLFTRKPSIEFPEAITERFKDALRQLSDIAKGLLQIFDDDDPALTGIEGEVLCNKTDDDRTFTSDLLGKF